MGFEMKGKVAKPEDSLKTVLSTCCGSPYFAIRAVSDNYARGHLKNSARCKPIDEPENKTEGHKNVV